MRTVMHRRGESSLISVLLCLVFSVGVCAADPWIITTPITVTEPMEAADIVVVSGGSLEIDSVPEPGVQLSGNISVVGTGSVTMTDSVIKVMSVYNGQYSLAAAENGIISVTGCNYSVPSGVQHAMYATDNGVVNLQDTDFNFLQLLAAGNSTITGNRLNGQFECIVQDAGNLSLTDIPRDTDSGSLWVWPTFTPNSTAEYSPPLPGFIDSFQFPPAGSQGLDEKFSLIRCEVKLWPMLVMRNCDLTLSNISADNWVVVGFHLPRDATVDGLINGQYCSDWDMPFSDRTVRVVNSTIDTWNLYPEKKAVVKVKNSLIGELLAMNKSVVKMENTTVDGSGGFFGASEEAKITAEGCTFTCNVQATQDSKIKLIDSLVLPYPEDPTGEWTTFGAYDNGVLYLGQTPAASTARLSGSGAIVVTYISNAPASPPPDDTPVELKGIAAVYCLDGSRTLSRWKLKAKRPGRRGGQVVGEGTTNVEDGTFGSWGVNDASKDRLLKLKVEDNLGTIYKSTVTIPGAGRGQRGMDGIEVKSVRRGSNACRGRVSSAAKISRSA